MITNDTTPTPSRPPTEGNLPAPSWLESYKQQGFYAPLPTLKPDEVEFFRSKLTEFLEHHQWKLDAVNRHKPHMYLRWAWELGQNPAILDKIRPILGNDILLWYSVIFVKPANSTGYVPWHQDSTYWAMNEEKGLTVWLALSDVTLENGCMKMIPGSHKIADIKHQIHNTADNMLHRGQTIKDLDESGAKPILLQPGDVSIHDLRTLHMSGPNLSDQARLGIAFRYIPASNYPRTLRFLKRTATLVSGQDKLKRFKADPVPLKDFDPEAVKAYRKSLRIAAVHTLFGDTSRSMLRKALDTLPILISRKTGRYLKYFGSKPE